jgi:hypothetical protein
VRVRRDPLAVHLAAEVEDLRFGEAALLERARVDARRGVALEEDQVAAVPFMGGTPEVVEADAEHVGHRSEARDVAAEVALGLVGLRDHHHRVPAHVGAVALFDRVIAGHARLEMRRDRVDVRGVRAERNVRAGAARRVDQPLEQIVRALRALALEHRVERFQPFLGLEGVRIVGGVEIGDGGHLDAPRGGRLPARRVFFFAAEA